MDNYKTWYICLKHSDNVETEIKKYLKKLLEPTAKFLVAKETATNGAHKKTDGEHYHFIAQITDKGYKAFMRHFVEKYELRGQAKNGIGRQYGMMVVKDQEKMCTYIAKEVEDNKGFVTTNFEEEDLNRYIKQSYKKFTYESYKFELFRHLTLTKNDEYSEYGIVKNIPIRLKIIEYHLEEMKKHETLKPIKRNQVQSLSDEYEQRVAKITAQELFDRWFN